MKSNGVDSMGSDSIFGLRDKPMKASKLSTKHREDREFGKGGGSKRGYEFLHLRVYAGTFLMTHWVRVHAFYT